MQGYLGSLQGALELSGGPLKLTLNNQPNSIEEALTQIEAQLDRRLPQNFRLVVVIDDLDRAEPSSVCDLLFALHKCFALPRLRYVLCYDQQQLAHKAEQHRQHGGDLSSQTLYEFLDKFVGARVYLHATYQGLQSYVEKTLLPLLESRPELKKWHGFISAILQDGALPLLRQMDYSDLFVAQNKINASLPLHVEQNHVYWRLLGDVRKLKWLYNQICLCWQDGLDLAKHDFNPRDLVYLLLLQHGYPETFRTLRAQAHSGEYLTLVLDVSASEEKAGSRFRKIY
ncbi:P-loop NTPase fold protein [Iodobacter sp. CM08]|uniref:P-loop NTPase fold protein n=1 Tax=Iodobacter sp. CM08 TaxID=3085902 RepID=UPI002981D678|nr:P-loop NTPase fold protein [Iodobacter sp. CM08]MDW5417892.1 P-loop NTPase fold protein [Iodobacter sp. CM08]